jgi:pimeloyl-ACP methyl ester carboxylesterase
MYFLFFWFSVIMGTIFGIFALLLIVIFTLLVYVANVLFHKGHKFRHASRNTIIESVEEKMFHSVRGGNDIKISSRCVYVEMNEKKPWKVNTTVVHLPSSISQKTRPSLVVVHGVASGSLVWIDCLVDLSKHYDIYCLDIPGFGRSETPVSLRSVSDYKDVVVIDNLLTLFLSNYILALGLDRPFVMGHSFGGHLALIFASRYPEMTSGVILCDPAGILPTLGRYGAYWGLFFWSSLLQRLLRLSGSVSRYFGYICLILI